MQEEHKKEAATPKATAQDAEAERKKKHAAAVEAFRASQARLGVAPPSRAAAPLREISPPPTRKPRTLADELDDDDDSPLRPQPALRAAEPKRPALDKPVERRGTEQAAASKAQRRAREELVAVEEAPAKRRCVRAAARRRASGSTLSTAGRVQGHCRC